MAVGLVEERRFNGLIESNHLLNSFVLKGDFCPSGFELDDLIFLISLQSDRFSLQITANTHSVEFHGIRFLTEVVCDEQELIDTCFVVVLPSSNPGSSMSWLSVKY